MRNILRKEMKLSASPLTYFFVLFGLMFFLPGYPILCSAFFTTLGLFQIFQNAREANDIVFSALLPIAKKDVVKGRFLFTCFIEGCSFVLMIIAAAVRMTALKDSVVYRANALMNANMFALGAALVIFGLFNWIFVGGFFKTVYKLGKPFVVYSVVCFLAITAAEALHHFPGLGKLNAFGTDEMGLQLSLLAAGILVFAVVTLLAYRKACKDFERIDL